MVEAVETLSVSISAPAFSLLSYDNVRSKYDQEGFLFGEIIEEKTNSITDHDRQITKLDRTMKINSTVTCPKVAYFYDGAGKLNESLITTFLENQKRERMKVVAWYKFKHTNGFKLTLREKIVHKNLAQYFAPEHPDLFVCCLLRAESSPNGATHTYAQTCLRYVDSSYQMIPMHIMNLSDPNNTYKSRDPSSDAFNELTKKQQNDGKEVPHSVMVTNINEELEKQTEEVVKELVEREKYCFELEEEVRKLMEALNRKLLSGNKTSTNFDKVDSESGDDNTCSMDWTDVVESLDKNVSHTSKVIDPVTSVDNSNTIDNMLSNKDPKNRTDTISATESSPSSTRGRPRRNKQQKSIE